MHSRVSIRILRNVIQVCICTRWYYNSKVGRIIEVSSWIWPPRHEPFVHRVHFSPSTRWAERRRLSPEDIWDYLVPKKQPKNERHWLVVWNIHFDVSIELWGSKYPHLTESYFQRGGSTTNHIKTEAPWLLCVLQNSLPGRIAHSCHNFDVFGQVRFTLPPEFPRKTHQIPSGYHQMAEKLHPFKAVVLEWTTISDTETRRYLQISDGNSSTFILLWLSGSKTWNFHRFL